VLNCALVCPDAVITVYRENRKNEKVPVPGQQCHRNLTVTIDDEGRSVSDLRLMKGNEALAEAAIRAGCQGYFDIP